MVDFSSLALDDKCIERWFFVVHTFHKTEPHDRKPTFLFGTVHTPASCRFGGNQFCFPLVAFSRLGGFRIHQGRDPLDGLKLGDSWYIIKKDKSPVGEEWTVDP